MATNQERARPADQTQTEAVGPPRLARRDYAGGEPRSWHLQESANFRRDRVRWGPIWGGLLAALTVFVLLSLLGLAIGLTNIRVGSLTGPSPVPADSGRNSAIWLAVSGIIAFLIGGFLAGRTAAEFNRAWGALNGAMVFFLAVPLIIWVATMSASMKLGSLGNSIQHNLGLVQSAASGDTARNAAWGTLAALLVALAMSAIGGAIGTQRPQVDPVSGAIRE
jgi:hypothetical protein